MRLDYREFMPILKGHIQQMILTITNTICLINHTECFEQELIDYVLSKNIGKSLSY